MRRATARRRRILPVAALALLVVALAFLDRLLGTLDVGTIRLAPAR